MNDVVAILDANVLFSPTLRDLLIRLSIQGLYQARWTRKIQDEWMKAVIKRRPDLDISRLQRTINLMEIALESAIVKDFEHLIPKLELPDPNDRHVLAAAILGNAQYIVSHNLKDFPDSALLSFELKGISPDDFILMLLHRDLDKTLSAMRRQRTQLKNPPKSPDEYIISLEKQGLSKTSEVIKVNRDKI